MARTAALHPRDPAGLHASPPTATGSSSCGRCPGRRAPACCGRWTSTTGEETLLADPVDAARRGRRRDAVPRGARPSRADARGRRRHHVLLHRQGRTAGGVRPVVPALRRRPGRRRGARAPGGRSGHRPAAVPRRAARWPTSPTAGCTWWPRTTARPARSPQPDGPDVTWGLAEFVASEELDRYRGHWWLPDGSGLCSSPASTRARSARGRSPTPRTRRPSRTPTATRRPAPPNAHVTLHHRRRWTGTRPRLRRRTTRRCPTS